jgi:small subunit ribosomal protein S17
MPRRILQGRVVSDKMDKTITVLVESRKMHPLFKKYVKQSWKYAAHDESNAFKTGDMVAIQECAPISKRKTWTVISDAATMKRSEDDANVGPTSVPHAKPSVKRKIATAKKAKK